MTNYQQTGTVFNIQKFSVHDGPGIRTIVFLKGCYLSCKWCSNPESQSFEPSILFHEQNCIGCGRCVSACKNGAINLSGSQRIDRSKCKACGTCAEVCPTQALVQSGKTMTVTEVLDEVCKDEIHFRRSGGGLTLSGGEPLGQPAFVEQLLKAAKEKGLHTAIETTGVATPETLQRIIPLLDVVLMDIKTFYSDTHKDFTGIPNEVVLKNALTISGLAKEMAIRVPVIPTFNADDQSIRAIAEFTRHLKNIKRLHLLPYHNYGQSKYELLNRDYEMIDVKTPASEQMLLWKGLVEAAGIECVIGG